MPPLPRDEVGPVIDGASRMSKEMQNGNVSVALAQYLAADDSHGYDQFGRDGDGTSEYVRVGYGDFAVHGGDYDCTSLVGEVAFSQGLMDEEMARSLYTGNAEELLGRSGYSKMPYSEDAVQPGDVLLRYTDPSRENGHAAIAVGDGMQVDASHGDGGITGDVGDQDGTEFLERPLQEGWQVIMRPPEGTHFDRTAYARSAEGRETIAAEREDAWARNASLREVAGGEAYAAMGHGGMDMRGFSEGIEEQEAATEAMSFAHAGSVSQLAASLEVAAAKAPRPAGPELGS